MKRIFKALFVLSIFSCLLVSGGEAKNKKPTLKGQTHLTIFGESLATQEQAVNFIKKYSPNARLNCSVEELVRLYFKEAQAEGIRPDVALSQALLETGFFRYGGDVKPYQNNYAGIGSVGGGAKGASFTTPEIGVRAHIQHILAYSSKRAPKHAIVDPRYNIVKSKPHYFGTSTKWTDLNGRWAASGVPYGERILDVHARLLQTPGSKGIFVEPKIEIDNEPKVEPNKKDKNNKHKMRDKIKDILKNIEDKK